MTWAPDGLRGRAAAMISAVAALARRSCSRMRRWTAQRAASRATESSCRSLGRLIAPPEDWTVDLAAWQNWYSRRQARLTAPALVTAGDLKGVIDAFYWHADLPVRHRLVLAGWPPDG